MKRWKRCLAVGLAVATMGATAACGNADSEKPKEKSGEKPKIVFWDMVWGNEESITIAEEMCAEYSKENNVDVEYQSVPWDNFYQTFLTAIAAGEAPDCSSGSSYMPMQFYDMDAIYPLDDMIAEMYEDGEIDDYVMKDLVEGYKYKDHYVALPTGIDMQVAYCRTDILEEHGLSVPTNWDEFRHCLEVLAEPENNKYGMVLIGNGNNGKTMFQWTINNGGGLFNENGEPDCVTDRNIEAVDYLLGLINDGLVNPASAGLTSDDSKSAFAKGEVAFHWGNPGLVSQLPDLADKIAVLPPLEGPHGDKASVYWNGGLMAYSQSEYPEETCDFMRWFAANMTSYCVDGKYSMFPVRNTVLEDPAYAEDPVVQDIVEDYLPVMKNIAANSDEVFSELSAVESDGTLDAVIQSMFTQGVTAEQILEKEQENLEMILGQ